MLKFEFWMTSAKALRALSSRPVFRFSNRAASIVVDRREERFEGERGFGSTGIAFAHKRECHIDDDLDQSIVSIDRRPLPHDSQSDSNRSRIEDTDRDLDDDDLISEIVDDTDLIDDASPQSIDISTDPDVQLQAWKAEALQSVQIVTHGLTWADGALDITQRLLSEPPMDTLTLYSFLVKEYRRHVHIALDKLADPMGSPSLDEISCFTKLLMEQLSEALGTEMTDSIEIEVSSPGAERKLRLPWELKRFRHLPMRVIYNETNKTSTKIMEFIRQDASTTIWRYWKGKHNRRVAKIRKAEFEIEFQIALEQIRQVTLFLDI